MNINVDFGRMSADEAEIRLRDLAQQAFGSGSKEGTNGGAGYIVINGEGLPVKVLTKLSERKWFACDSTKDAQLIKDAIGLDDYSHTDAREYIFKLIEKLYADCNLTVAAKDAIKDALGYQGHGEKPLERRQVAAALTTARDHARMGDIWKDCSADTKVDTRSQNVFSNLFEVHPKTPDEEKLAELGLTAVHQRQMKDFEELFEHLKTNPSKTNIENLNNKVKMAFNRLMETAKLSTDVKTKLFLVAYSATKALYLETHGNGILARKDIFKQMNCVLNLLPQFK